ncbi:nitrite reductase small subunit NirD [Actinomadura rudentiformis]|uniref:Nitrite reductase small subunit NirD n=1 Tax=Actinomadura rudentiformis TaxID=359158 RepID=A0A6H9YGG0_9ACTN|nr:nitrite reductase small subunit NirD [Actinomadura rudentiformis]KAB2339470.1 nitrite reductase small subunit NirD [Actinomadura rudentiformis]
MTTTPDMTITRDAAALTTAVPTAAGRWVDVCSYPDLIPERGVCAMVGGLQVAVFRTFEGELFAVSNFDPFSNAYVISRGILGSRAGAPTVASPMFKDVFDLRTGVCLADPEVALPTFPIRRNPVGDRVEVALPDEYRGSDEHRE